MKQRLTDELSRIAEIDEKAANGYQRIHENEKRVLELSKKILCLVMKNKASLPNSEVLRTLKKRMPLCIVITLLI